MTVEIIKSYGLQFNGREDDAMRMMVRVLLLVLFTVCTSAQAPVVNPRYEIYAIRYATIGDFPVAGLVSGADPSRKLDIAMMVLPSGKERTKEEYSDLAGKCGLRLQRVLDTQSPYSIVEMVAA